MLMVAERVEAALDGPKSITPPNVTALHKRKASMLIDAPRYRRNFVWDPSTSSNISPSALYTETAEPLPLPPQHLLNDPIIRAALDANKDFIKVETPFDVDKLENLLIDHPAPLFVHSVMHGLRHGFWPCDDGEWKVELEEVLGNYSSEEPDLAAIRAFRDREQTAGRWSSEIPELLPGMKTSPMFVVWQSQKPRVVTDHSGSGINDHIPRADAKVRYDNMHDFGHCLRDVRRAYKGRRLVLFKDDVASAFLNLPAHPIWQLRQVVSVDGKLYIVRRFVFGNRASPRIWCAVSGLLCWIAVRKLDIVDLHVYMDDFFGWDFEGNEVFYHGKRRPRRQVQLLIFWESICCPFEDKKQEHGATLKIIGFWVDINRGTISLSPSSVTDIIDKINTFLSFPGRAPALRDWQRLAGHLNWLLNVLPWGRPALTELYRKMSGKMHSYRGIYINAAVTVDLKWLASIIPGSIGVRLVDAGLWRVEDADMVMWTDASLRLGLSFVLAGNGFYYPLRERQANVTIDIFFLELVAILSAVHYAASLPHPPRKLVIFTDSLDSVGVFNSLRASQAIHNGPLLAVAGLMLNTGIDLRVLHIEGKKNLRADFLSRLLLAEYSRKFPSDRVRSFVPPRESLPARWRECF